VNEQVRFYGDGDASVGLGVLLGERCRGEERGRPWSAATLVRLNIEIGWTGVVDPDWAHYGTLSVWLEFGEELAVGSHGFLLVGYAFGDFSMGARYGFHFSLVSLRIELSHQVTTWEDGEMLHALRFGVSFNICELFTLFN